MRGILAATIALACACGNRSSDGGGGATRPRTCEEMAKRGIELMLADPDTPQERRDTINAHKDDAIAAGAQACKDHHASPEAIACFVEAKDRDAYMACGKKFFPND